jgi:hypothetical protein
MRDTGLLTSSFVLCSTQMIRSDTIPVLVRFRAYRSLTLRSPHLILDPNDPSVQSIFDVSVKAYSFIFSVMFTILTASLKVSALVSRTNKILDVMT